MRLPCWRVVALIAIEAVRRLLEPAPVAGGVGDRRRARSGLAVNLVAAWVLSRASGSLNARGALLHVMGDLLGSLAALVAGGVILATGWMPIDPILSLAVALLILRSTWQLLKQSTGVLMEGVPTHLDYDAIGRSLAALPGVADVHDLHIWNMSSEGVALSAHLSLARGDDWLALLAQAQADARRATTGFATRRCSRRGRCRRRREGRPQVIPVHPPRDRRSTAAACTSADRSKPLQLAEVEVEVDVDRRPSRRPRADSPNVHLSSGMYSKFMP